MRMRTFTGESLREVAFPLGGIGTGTVSLGGRGNLRDWEIFNRPAKGRNLPYSFFAIRAAGMSRVLERRLLPPFAAGSGLPTAQMSGLPRFAEARFMGEYPLAGIEFIDDSFPVQVSLEAWNPFIPMNDLDSGIPVAIFVWSSMAPRSPLSCCLCPAVSLRPPVSCGKSSHLAGEGCDRSRSS